MTSGWGHPAWATDGRSPRIQFNDYKSARASTGICDEPGFSLRTRHSALAKTFSPCHHRCSAVGSFSAFNTLEMSSLGSDGRLLRA